MFSRHRYELAAWFALPVLVTCFYVPWWPGGETAKYIPAAIAAVTGLAFLSRWRLDSIDYLLLGLAGYAGLSVLWAVDPWGAIDAFIPWVLFTIIALLVRRAPEEPLQWGVLFAALVAFVSNAILPEYYAGFGNENFATIWMVLAIPFMAALRNGWGMGGIFAVLIYLFFLNPSRLEFVALAAMGLYLAYMLRSWWLAGGVVLGLIFAVAGVAGWSMETRFDLWLAAVRMALEMPMLGAGLGGFDTLYSAYAPTNDTVIYSYVFAAGEAHSDWLQLVTDLGLAGFGLVVAIILTAWRRMGVIVWPRFVLVGVAALMAVDFPMQQPAVVLLVAMAFGMAVPSERRLSSAWEVRSKATFAIPLALCLAFSVWRMSEAQDAFAKTAASLPKNAVAAHLWNERALYMWPFDKHMRRELLLNAARSGVDRAGVDRGIAAARSAYFNHPRIEAIIKELRHES